MLDDLTRRHRALNLATAEHAALYAEHRQRITDLLLFPARGGRLCVLGAGNCIDLNLEALAERYDEIALVDLDAQSLSEAVARQPDAWRSKLRPRAPVELSGLARVFGEALAAETALPRADDAAEGVAAAIGDAPFDVAVSTCVLSQMILAVAERFGPGHARCIELVQLVRAVHLKLVLRLLEPGGTGVLVSDMVSTDTCPGLLSTPGEQLPQRMRQLVAQRNFFTGINPFLIEALLAKDPSLAPHVRGPRLLDPWVWRIGQERGYLVFAVTFERCGR